MVVRVPTASRQPSRPVLTATPTSARVRVRALAFWAGVGVRDESQTIRRAPGERFVLSAHGTARPRKTNTGAHERTSSSEGQRNATDAPTISAMRSAVRTSGVVAPRSILEYPD